MRDRKTNEIVYEEKEIKEMVPNMEFIRKYNLSLESEPHEWFNAFLPIKKSKTQLQNDGPFTVGNWCKYMNQKAMYSNAGKGGTVYRDFVPFTVEEMMKHIGIYILNGVSPSPQVEMKMSPQEQDEFNGNDMVYMALGKNAMRRHKHFKCFFAVQDPNKPIPSRKTHPNWKCEALLKHALRVCKEAVIPGEFSAIDEQTIGFQGKHEDKKRHDEKKEGDGFQCDSINVEGGYTWAFYFRNQPPPPKYIDMGLCPLHARTLSLIVQLSNPHHCIYMDNLYLSAKLCLFVWKEAKAKIHGVCRQGGRGIPDAIKQDAKTKQNEEYQARGTLKVAVCKGMDGMIDIICTSLYDVKPFYMMSTVSANVSWVKKWMTVFCATTRKKVKVPFYRLNLADEYNNRMGRVDVGDQLRNYYRFDHFMRKRKWWWSFWMWTMGMLLTNAFILHQQFHELHKSKPKYNHYQFVCRIAKAWLQPEEHCFSKKRTVNRKRNQDDQDYDDSTTVTAMSTLVTGRSRRSTASASDMTAIATLAEPIIKKRKAGFSDSTINTKFRNRLSNDVPHWPVPTTTVTQSRCQLHTWATNAKIRKKSGVVRCESCDVHLCIDCFKIFHATKDLVKEKPEI